jgi:hypothetical protein
MAEYVTLIQVLVIRISETSGNESVVYNDCEQPLQCTDVNDILFPSFYKHTP